MALRFSWLKIFAIASMIVTSAIIKNPDHLFASLARAASTSTKAVTAPALSDTIHKSQAKNAPPQKIVAPDIDLAPDPFTPAVNVLIRNSGNAPFNGKISLSNPDNFLGASHSVQAFAVSPGSLTQMKFSLPGAAMVPDSRYSFIADMQSSSVKLSASRLLNFFRIERAQTPPALDGTMIGWLNASMIVVNVPGSLPGKKGWKGRADLTATARFLWDADHLYLMVRRTDDIIRLASSASDPSGDRVRIAISPTGSHFSDSSWVTADIVLLENGVAVVRHADPSMKLSNGTIKSAKASVVDQNGVSVYSASIPWKELGVLKGVKLKRIGLTARAIDDDGNGSNSWLQWGDGADIPANPPLFADASLGD